MRIRNVIVNSKLEHLDVGRGFIPRRFSRRMRVFRPGINPGPTIAIALLVLLVSSCGSDFDPFNLINKLRVMAIQTDPPELEPGQTATIKALVYSPDPNEIEYSWSWCPVTKGRVDGYECAVTEEEIVDQLEAALPGSSSQIPSFDLGNEPEASFDYMFSPLLIQALCEESLSQEIPELAGLIDCEDSLPITIRLEVKQGEETVAAIKSMDLALEVGGELNTNPTLGQVSASNGAAFEILPEDAPAMVEAGRTLDVRVEVPESSIDVFTPAATEDDPEPEERSETLFLTWFITGGETEFRRTTFFDGEISLSDLGQNSWKLPNMDEQPSGSAKIFLVIQDERGGVGWTERTVELTE